MSEGYRVRARPLTGEQSLASLLKYAALAAQHGVQSTQALAVRNRIVEGNLGLVFVVWKAHGRRLIPLDDVLGIGAQGLIKAVERFDHTRGYRFSTYAAWWIRHALGRTGQNEAFTIRVPVHVQNPTTSAKAECRDAAVAARRLRSLDTPVSEDSGDTFGSLLHDDAQTAFDAIHNEQQATALTRAMAALPARLRAVVEQRSEGRTLAELAADMGASREQVRQLEAEALGQLRRALAA
jgi:RNA polymerase primary sigma factor